jgi:hypothetical protein
LFKTVADLDATQKEEITRFMKDYRIIDAGADVSVIDVTSGSQLLEAHRQSNRRSTEEWQKEILALKTCVSLWEMIQAQDVSRLSQHIRWEADPSRGHSVAYYGPAALDSPMPDKQPVVRTVIASAVDDPKLMQQFLATDLMGPAIVYLERLINEHLKTGIQVRMFRTFNERFAGVLKSLGRPGKKLALHLVPSDPLAALWLQFAQAIDGDKRYRRCAECNAWFEVGHGKKHKDRQYCSDYCKVKAYRRRMETARELAKQGKKPREIAAFLNADIDSVKSWTRDIRKGK